jgi:hypothetical protein
VFSAFNILFSFGGVSADTNKFMCGYDVLLVMMASKKSFPCFLLVGDVLTQWAATNSEWSRLM